MRLFLAAAAFALLAGCGQPGSEYLGKWVSTKNAKTSVEIERNGDSFMVRRTATSFSGKPRTMNLPAMLQGDVLQVSTGFGGIALAVDKASGHLTAGGEEYTKQE